jgi:hypothetical protein
MNATDQAITLVRKVAASGTVPTDIIQQCERIAETFRTEIPIGLYATINGEKYVMPWEWFNEEQLMEVYESHPEWKPSTLWKETYKEGAPVGIGYPGRVYQSPEEFLVDSACIQNIVQPKGGRMIGGGLWFIPIEDPEKWWLEAARPIYTELFQTNERVYRVAAERLAKLAKSAVEHRTFPFNR